MTHMQEPLTRNFHLPLPDSLYRALRLEAERRRRSATALAREVLEQWFKGIREEALHADIADYAAKHTGTTADLDRDLEAAGLGALAAGNRSKPKQSCRKAKSK